MYEFHGWVSAAYESCGENIAVINMIEGLKKPGFQIQSGASNGAFIASFNGCSNHDRNSAELQDAFSMIARLDGEAFGVLHIFDDEQTHSIRTLVLSDGEVKNSDAPLFGEGWK